MASDLKTTLNLPKTAFPMRASLVSREPERLAHWEKIDLYERVQAKNAGADAFILHDGPPYANGDIHLGTALNKILKDIIIRYKSMRGYRAPYVPGWDCHGLPIEQRVLRDIGSKIHDMEPAELRRLCHKYASKYINIQRSQFKRLGVSGDWEKPYTTFSPCYEAGILRALCDLVDKGLVVKGLRSVAWDPIYRTALAEAEIEYEPHVSDSIYVRFPLLEPERYEALQGLRDVSIVIWTTTPWTLPANLGVCLHPGFTYVAYVTESDTFILAEELLDAFKEACDLKNGRIAASFEATEFDRGACSHPIFEGRRSLIMLGEHVTLDQGTGCVHTAPGHGSDDFAIGRAYGLPVVVPVDDRGCFTAEYEEMEGTFVFDANPRIVESLRSRGLLLKAGKISHDYPYSWRSKKPVIFRATEQWFMELDKGDVRNKALHAIDHSVEWFPPWGQDRIRDMVERRPDWCLSRQRSWGVPIPSIRSRASGDSILDRRVIDRFLTIVAEEGTDAWYARPVEDFLPPDFDYAPTGERDASCFEKEFDILDVWFDSGSSHIACLEQDERLRSPADLYLEGSDQHRGWFQSALLTSVGARDRAPFRQVLTHGFVLDAEGRAMSKSLGNFISPQDLIKKNGADILRLWVASEDSRNDVSIGEESIKRLTDAYRTIRNTLRFQLGNLYDFCPQKDSLSLPELKVIDRWVLHKTADLIEEVTQAFECYQFHRVFQLCNRFCRATLSATYHDMLKDRLYTFGAESAGRRSAQTALHEIFQVLSRLLAPILVFTADEAFCYASGDGVQEIESVHLQTWPQIKAGWRDSETAGLMEQILALRGRVNEQLETLRQDKVIGQSLEAKVVVMGHPEDPAFIALREQEEVMEEIFIVSRVVMVPESTENGGLRVLVEHLDGSRCPRCWRSVETLNASPYGEVCTRCLDALSTF